MERTKMWKEGGRGEEREKEGRMEEVRVEEKSRRGGCTEEFIKNNIKNGKRGRKQTKREAEREAES